MIQYTTSLVEVNRFGINICNINRHFQSNKLQKKKKLNVKRRNILFENLRLHDNTIFWLSIYNHSLLLATSAVS